MNRLARTSRRWPRRAFAVLAIGATLAVLGVSRPAIAGDAQFLDAAGLLTSADRLAIERAVRAYPFDARVVASTSYAARDAFDQFVRAQLSAPNMVVVGVDPEHRRTSVRFGTGARIAPSEFKSIDDAGDPYFRRKEWAGGIGAILARANAAVGTAGAGAVPGTAGGASTRTGVLGLLGGGVCLFVVLAIVVVGILFAVFRRRSAPGPMQAGGPPVGNIPGGAYGPGYPYPQGGGGGGIGSHLGAAALGGLAGYGIGRMMDGDHHHGHRNDADMTGGGNDPGAGSGSSGYDAGGSSSGWDDSSGGGGDVGGGGGDFGGGGGDFGGGGGDFGGGGGGDW